ncbi:MAG TPA: HGGxSTG domain-containing protein [Gammaproteobacteria bacterium]|nr:HGGxSTG domain-containing protein [Gammaproteobacteria bacterium]
MAGHWRPYCRAHCKGSGKPCRARALPNGRCRFHGGLSTGPKTPEGKRRALANLKQYRAAD